MVCLMCMSSSLQALESVPHHDFLYHAKRKFPSSEFSPLSTPISRQLKEKLHQSRRPEVRTLCQLYLDQLPILSTNISINSYSFIFALEQKTLQNREYIN